ncbi:MAG: hypothetical protein IJN40_00670 [Clostridia bacterium]|nr:hypothetical protein [Clostridia bacterium]
MNQIKGFYVILIVFSVSIQFGRILTNETQYEKIFKVISSFLIISLIVAGGISLIKNNVDDGTTLNIAFDIQDTNIKNEFENKLEDTIKIDIHNKFYVNYDIDVDTDFKKLKIFVVKKGTSMDEKVENHIISNYCTSEDEVYMINENN